MTGIGLGGGGGGHGWDRGVIRALHGDHLDPVGGWRYCVAAIYTRLCNISATCLV